MNTREQFGDFNTFVKFVDGSITEFEDDTLKLVGNYGFGKCSNLTKVVLPVVETIGESAFRDCSMLVDISIPSEANFEGRAFGSCSSLLKIVLPKVKQIGFMMFGSCTSLTSVRLPAVISIKSSAFSNCSNLISLIIETPNQVASLASKDALTSATKCIIYVPDELVDSYKSATNWSNYASRIKPLSELPAEE